LTEDEHGFCDFKEEKPEIEEVLHNLVPQGTLGHRKIWGNIA
jgi:hypothetical protein